MIWSSAQEKRYMAGCVWGLFCYFLIALSWIPGCSTVEPAGLWAMLLTHSYEFIYKFTASKDSCGAFWSGSCVTLPHLQTALSMIPFPLPGSYELQTHGGFRGVLAAADSSVDGTKQYIPNWAWGCLLLEGHDMPTLLSSIVILHQSWPMKMHG